MEKLKNDYTGYDHRVQKQSNLTSHLDTPVERTEQRPMYEEPKHVPEQARDSQMVKQTHLASVDPATGKSSTNGYSQSSDTEVIDWIVSGLPPNFEASQFKKIAMVKHMVKAIVDEDTFKGTCLGTGRIQIRLNHGESSESVRMNF